VPAAVASPSSSHPAEKPDQQKKKGACTGHAGGKPCAIREDADVCVRGASLHRAQRSLRWLHPFEAMAVPAGCLLVL